MKHVVVPVDFSDVSKNAARYAVDMAAALPETRCTLFHIYEEIYAGSDGSPLHDEGNARQKIFDAALENLRTEINPPASLELDVVADKDASFAGALQRYVSRQLVDLLVMGITGTTKAEQIILGSNTIVAIRKKVAPVMIIPSLARFNGLKNVVFAADFKEFEDLKVFDTVRSLLDLFRSKVHVVHVSKDAAESEAEHQHQKQRLQQELSAFAPEFVMIRDADIAGTIDQYAVDHGMDAVLTIPRKHALGGLLQPSYTKRLAYLTQVPVIAVHE